MTPLFRIPLATTVSAILGVTLVLPATALDRKMWVKDTAKFAFGALVCQSPACGGSSARISASAYTGPAMATLQDWQALQRKSDSVATAFGIVRYYDASEDRSSGGGKHYVSVMHSYGRTSTVPTWYISGYVEKGKRLFSVSSSATTRPQAEANYLVALSEAR